MTLEEQTKALEDEAAAVNKELKQALLDIRARLMEMTSPLRKSGNISSASEGPGKEETPDGNGSGKAP